MEMRCDERVGHRLYPLRRMHRKQHRLASSKECSISGTSRECKNVSEHMKIRM